MSKQFDRLTLLDSFIRIADSGSISAAARDLGISQPSASRHLVELESMLETQLIRRNTHSLALTDAGLDLLKDARILLADWESMEEKHVNVENQVKGSLKVVAPVALGQEHLARLATEFQLQHPMLTLSWQLEDSQIRFTEVGCDCWIKVGDIADDTLIVRKIASVERLLVSSPSLQKRALLPQQAQVLPVIALTPFEGQRIPLSDGKTTEEISFQSIMQTNNIFAAKEAALMGLGAVVMPRWFVEEELQAGGLIDVCPGWQAPKLSVHIAFLPNKHKPLRLSMFTEFIEEGIKRVPGIVDE